MASVCEPTPTIDCASTQATGGASTQATEGVQSSRGDPIEGPRRRNERMRHRVSWPVFFWLGVIHLSALLVFVPALFSWWSVGLMFFLHWLTGGIGVCLGFHRLFTHRSFQTYRPIRFFLAVTGEMAGEGSVLSWVCTHRRHHAYSDDVGDPHSPHDGAWWSHILWTFGKHDREEVNLNYERWIPDLADNSFLRFLDRMFIPLHVASAVVFFAIGAALGGPRMGCSLVVWGVSARLVFVMHSTWLVNSASHMWGYRNYETTDDSRNNWVVAAFSYGEGWHNNHHAYPTMARHGHKWWEFDATFLTIRLMEACGLAWNVVDHKHKCHEQDSTVKVATRLPVSVDSILRSHRSKETGNPHHVVSESDAVPKA
jgi:fatty-acid desaturase